MNNLFGPLQSIFGQKNFQFDVRIILPVRAIFDCLAETANRAELTVGYTVMKNAGQRSLPRLGS